MATTSNTTNKPIVTNAALILSSYYYTTKILTHINPMAALVTVITHSISECAIEKISNVLKNYLHPIDLNSIETLTIYSSTYFITKAIIPITLTEFVKLYLLWAPTLIPLLATAWVVNKLFDTNLCESLFCQLKEFNWIKS